MPTSTKQATAARATIKRRVYQALEPGDDASRLAQAINLGIIALIGVSVITTVVETVEGVQARFGGLLLTLELFTVVVFTAEYGLRLWVCTLEPRYAHPVRGRLRYVLTPGAVIDLLAILPFFLVMLVQVDFRMLRLLRLFRLARVFKLGRYSEALQTMGETVRAKKEELVLSLSGGVFLLLLAASLMYMLESEAQPEAFPSIPAAMWWGVATLTTVGYGDVVPVTPLGRLAGAFIAIFGLGLFALPAGILASGFSEAVARQKERDAGAGERRCPHCGKPFEEEQGE